VFLHWDLDDMNQSQILLAAGTIGLRAGGSLLGIRVVLDSTGVFLGPPDCAFCPVPHYRSGGNPA
jgi:hypothetical protein